MCGIAGILKFTDGKIDLQALIRMTDAIPHRGPDGQGHWVNVDQNVCLGHRRLSIIDLSELGAQPMHYSDGRYTITFNGEIYNYIELKKKLKEKGYAFRSDTDTEVLLALYDHKKEKCLEDLDGMFAFAIWDEKTQELFCARDRFGEKPFHYYIDEGKFVFASELKQFWAFGISKEIDPLRLDSYITHGETDDQLDPTKTFYKKVIRLDSAHYMFVHCNGNVKIKQYWQIDKKTKKFDGTIEEAAEQFLKLFTTSTSLRLRSDVPVGTSLSGGLDSSSICLIVDQLKGFNQRQTSFSARFKDFAKDEGHYIETVTKACTNIDSHYVWPDDDYFLRNLERVSYHQDEPFSSTSVIAQFAVMELAKREGVTVLIDGQGADEYLAGYKTYYPIYLNQLYYHDLANYESEVEALKEFYKGEDKNLMPKVWVTTQMKIGKYRRLILKQDQPYGERELYSKLMHDTTSQGLKTLLRYADRNSAAHSREVRLPFLSHSLVEFVFSLPDSFKLSSGWTKFVLRKAMNSVLPNAICWRKDKIGYEAPQNMWLKNPKVIKEIENSQHSISRKLDLSISELQKVDKWRLLVLDQYL